MTMGQTTDERCRQRLSHTEGTAGRLQIRPTPKFTRVIAPLDIMSSFAQQGKDEEEIQPPQRPPSPPPHTVFAVRGVHVRVVSANFSSNIAMTGSAVFVDTYLLRLPTARRAYHIYAGDYACCVEL